MMDETVSFEVWGPTRRKLFDAANEIAKDFFGEDPYEIVRVDITPSSRRIGANPGVDFWAADITVQPYTAAS